MKNLKDIKKNLQVGQAVETQWIGGQRDHVTSARVVIEAKTNSVKFRDSEGRESNLFFNDLTKRNTEFLGEKSFRVQFFSDLAAVYTIR